MTYASQRIVTISKGKKTARVVITAFEKVWKDRGWKLVEAKPEGGLTAKETGSESITTEDEKKKEGVK